MLLDTARLRRVKLTEDIVGRVDYGLKKSPGQCLCYAASQVVSSRRPVDLNNTFARSTWSISLVTIIEPPVETRVSAKYALLRFSKRGDDLNMKPIQYSLTHLFRLGACSDTVYQAGRLVLSFVLLATPSIPLPCQLAPRILAPP